MLDDDNREVKILQEMLLEDGELHGTGRKRQFRWKNIGNIHRFFYTPDIVKIVSDATDDGDSSQTTEDNITYFDDEESEEQWRKNRHQREMFLKKVVFTSQIEALMRVLIVLQQMSSDPDIEDVTSETDSQILRLGQKAIQKSGLDQFVVEKGSRRGSFLSRSEIILAKLAQCTKVDDSPVVGAPKVSTKFIFPTVGNNISNEVSQFGHYHITRLLNICYQDDYLILPAFITTNC